MPIPMLHSQCNPGYSHYGGPLAPCELPLLYPSPQAKPASQLFSGASSGGIGHASNQCKDDTYTRYHTPNAIHDGHHSAQNFMKGQYDPPAIKHPFNNPYHGVPPLNGHFNQAIPPHIVSHYGLSLNMSNGPNPHHTHSTSNEACVPPPTVSSDLTSASSSISTNGNSQSAGQSPQISSTSLPESLNQDRRSNLNRARNTPPLSGSSGSIPPNPTSCPSQTSQQSSPSPSPTPLSPETSRTTSPNQALQPRGSTQFLQHLQSQSNQAATKNRTSLPSITIPSSPPCSSTSSSPQSSPPSSPRGTKRRRSDKERREKHNDTERKGRQKINIEISILYKNDRCTLLTQPETLKNLLPELQNSAAPKVSVLQCAVDTIKRRTEYANSMQAQNAHLRDENKSLRAEILRLQHLMGMASQHPNPLHLLPSPGAPHHSSPLPIESNGFPSAFPGPLSTPPSIPISSTKQWF